MDRPIRVLQYFSLHGLIALTLRTEPNGYRCRAGVYNLVIPMRLVVPDSRNRTPRPSVCLVRLFRLRSPTDSTFGVCWYTVSPHEQPRRYHQSSAVRLRYGRFVFRVQEDGLVEIYLCCRGRRHRPARTGLHTCMGC